MGVYRRADSPFWWLWLETTHRREPTKIRIGTTPKARRESRALADEHYHKRMLATAARTHQLSGAEPEDREQTTFAAYAKVYARDVIAHHKGAVRERELLAVLIAAFGADTLDAITRDRVRAWMTDRRAKVSAATVNRELDLLKAMLRDAIPRYLTASPIAGLPRLKGTPPRRRILSPDEERRLLEACEDAQDRALFILGIDTLQRMGDLLDLQRSDRHGIWIDIRDTKNNEAIEVPLSPRAVEALNAIRGKKPYYFTKFRQAENPRDWRGSVRQRLEYLCGKATPKIPFGRKRGGITFHWATRRTGTTRLVVDRQTPIPIVQRLGNWYRPDVPLGIYSEARREDLAAAVGQGSRVTHARAKSR